MKQQTISMWQIFSENSIAKLKQHSWYRPGQVKFVLSK